MVYRREVHRPRLPLDVHDRQRGRRRARRSPPRRDSQRAVSFPRAPCVRIVWFWCAQIVGQGRVNLSDLRGLTDGDVEGVIGTRLTQRGSPMPVLPARTHGSFHPTVLGVTAPSTDRTHLTGANAHAALAAVVGRAAIAVVASRSVAKYFTLADAAFALVGTRAGIAVVAGRPVGTPLAEGYCGRGRAGRCCRCRAGGGRRDDDS